MPIHRACLVPALAVALLAAGPAAAQTSGVAAQPEPAASPQGAEVRWIVRGSPAGSAVRLRLRGEVLEHVLDAGHWTLQGPGGPVPARLVLPPEPVTPAAAELTDFTARADGRDLLVTIDRGADGFAINRLELQLARDEVLCRATIAASGDDVSYFQVGAPQLIFQQIAEGGIVRVSTLELQDTTERYIRIRLAGQSTSTLTSAACWYKPEYSHPSYQVQASLGTMREGSLPGESVWPLLLEGRTRPLLKMKVLADVSGATRRIRLTRLEQEDTDPMLDSQFLWVSGIASGGLAIDNRWLELPALEYGNDLALVVEDTEGAIMQLTGVEAYAAEVYLELELPELHGTAAGTEAETRLTLWQSDSTGPEAGEIEAGAAVPRIVGEFRNWSLARDLPEVRPAFPVAGVHWYEYWWLKSAGYAFCALLLLLLGLVLLRRPRARA